MIKVFINLLIFKWGKNLETFCLDAIIIDWNGWTKIDKVEVERGITKGKPREKIVDVNEMLQIGGTTK